MRWSMDLLAFALLVALVRVTEAQYNCYHCLLAETKEVIDGFDSNCPEPFVPDGVESCSGTACIIMWHDFGSLGYGINRTCYLEQPPGPIDQCLTLNHFQTQYTFFMYQGLCCFNTQNSIMYNGTLITFVSTVCICTSDFCNGNIPNYITTLAPGQTKPPAATSVTAAPATAPMKSSGEWVSLSQALLAAAILLPTYMASV